MKFNIAQIGKNRLKRVLVNDREQNPQKLCEILESDFSNVSKCYMEEPMVKVDVVDNEDEISFFVKITTHRIKTIGVLDA